MTEWVLCVYFALLYANTAHASLVYQAGQRIHAELWPFLICMWIQNLLPSLMIILPAYEKKKTFSKSFECEEVTK